jgi:hypothetical protein
MRWVCVLLLVTATASAKVIMIPAIARECSEQKTWGEVMKCAGEHGHAKLEKSLPHARLIRITHDHDEQSGLYLFVEAKGWRLGGMTEYAGELLGFDNPTLGTHGAYRYELGITERNGDNTVIRREQVYCGGVGYRCTTVVTACDVLVAGKAIETFRGTVSWHHDHLRIAGDRTHAGGECAQAEEVNVWFPETEID